MVMKGKEITKNCHRLKETEEDINAMWNLEKVHWQKNW